MGLADLTPASDAGSNGKSSSSSSTGRWTLTGVSPSDFPVYVNKMPYLVLRETEDGWDYLQHPETPVIQVRFDWYGDYNFENVGHFRKHEGWRRWWWSEESFQTYSRKVEKELNEDLRLMLKERPHKVVGALEMAANTVLMERRIPTESCPVCGTDIHVLHDEYETINRRRVCSDHTVRDLANADLLQ